VVVELVDMVSRLRRREKMREQSGAPFYKVGGGGGREMSGRGGSETVEAKWIFIPFTQ
jgi:hypothetical protein